MNKNFYNIDDVSQLVGEQKHTIRFWESRIKKLKVIRTQSGHRLYDYENLLLLKKISKIKEKGKISFIISSYAKNCGFKDISSTLNCKIYKPLISTNLIN